MSLFNRGRRKRREQGRKDAIGQGFLNHILSNFEKRDDISDEGRSEIASQMEAGFRNTQGQHITTFGKGHLDLLVSNALKSPLEKSRMRMQTKRKLLLDRPGQRGFFS